MAAAEEIGGGRALAGGRGSGVPQVGTGKLAGLRERAHLRGARAGAEEWRVGKAKETSALEAQVGARLANCGDGLPDNI